MFPSEMTRITLVTLLAICLLAISQAAPLFLERREDTTGATLSPQLVLDLYECWKQAGDTMNAQSMQAEPCSKSMEGDRSSHNSTIPAADTIEAFVGAFIDEASTPAITHNDKAFHHVIQFKFNVSSISGSLLKTEVRVYHKALSSTSSLGCDPMEGIRLKLLKVNAENKATKIDDVLVKVDHNGWAIFDPVDYDWSSVENQGYKLAVAVSGDCSSVSLKQLGFDDTTPPMLVAYTIQERMTTEVKVLPSSLVDTLLEDDTDTVGKRQAPRNSRPLGCHLQNYTVNFEEVGLNILMPKSLNVRICKGSCNHPVAHNERNTIYATIKSHAAKYDENLKIPSCVPISYQKQPLVFYSSGTKQLYVLHKAEAIATGCGCR